MIRPPLVVVVTALLGLLVGCSGADDVLAEAGSALRAGRIEEAAAVVADLEGEEADALRGRITAADDHRIGVRADLEALHARVPRDERARVFAVLDDLARGETDPVLKEEISFAKSRIYDAYAASSRTWSRGQQGTTELPADLVSTKKVEEASVPDPPPTTTTARTTPAPPAEKTASAEAPVDEGEGTESILLESRTPETAREFEEAAREALRAGALEVAHPRLLEAAARAEEAELRTLLIEEARDIEDRLRLRTELADGFFADPAPFVDLGIDGVDAKAGIEVDGEAVAWKGVPLVRWIALGKTIALSTRAELGLLGERLVRDDDLRVWKQLRRLSRAERIEETEIFALIARHRGEVVPEGGYVYDGRDWLAAGMAADRTREKLLANLTRDFARAGVEERDGLFDEFLDEGFAPELRAALQARWDDLTKRLLKNAGARRLREVASKREELDRRRQEALDLIFDEEEYFYPYHPPACPPERAKLYPAVQRRVDELVKAVRDVWKDDTRVSVRGGLEEILEEARWLVRREDEWGKASVLPDELPYWILGIDPNLESIGLAEFAWDEEERDDLARSRAIRARNVRLWESDAVPENGRAASTIERRQVEITNDYRLLLGRRALAWNPLIQAAAFDHSEYMAKTGDFGHFEPDPARKGPGERMRRRGYDRGAGENCHGGGGDPMGAHVGWCHSSGHHRNLLGRDHREMASGLVGRYWTQDFGADDSFLAELSEWSD